MEMAREEKRVELRQVEETPPRKDDVVRLESDQPTVRPKVPRMPALPAEAPPRHRLEVPTREGVETRTHQPTMDALIEPQTMDPDAMERDWGKNQAEPPKIPWGWLALAVALAIGGAVWSLTREKPPAAATVQAAAISRMEEDAEEERRATELVTRMEATVRKFFAASSVEEMAAVVRQPERVVPLMTQYYRSHPLPQKQVARVGAMEPLTIEQRAVFWVATAEMPDGASKSVFLEVLPDGEPRVDWETYVTYQPMPWSRFVAERPVATPLDFRVYAEPDNFFSHEFADATVWRSIRLSVTDSEEVLFGYVKIGSPEEAELVEVFERNGGRESAVTLRLVIPPGLESRRGVLIEKVVSGRWLYLDPPGD